MKYTVSHICKQRTQNQVMRGFLFEGYEDCSRPLYLSNRWLLSFCVLISSSLSSVVCIYPYSLSPPSFSLSYISLSPFRPALPPASLLLYLFVTYEGGPGLTLWMLLKHVPLYFLRQDLSLPRESPWRLDWLPNKLQGSSLFYCFSTGIAGPCPRPRLLPGCGRIEFILSC